MDSFGQFFYRLWMSRLPLQLAYAICTAAVFEILVWLVNSRVQRLLRPTFARDKGAEPSMRAARMRFLLRPPQILVRTVLYVLAIAIILRIFGLILRFEVFPILGAVAAGALVACWGLLQDCVRGYLLVYQHAFWVGDEISVSGMRGTVLSVSLPNTFLRAEDGSEVLLANGSLRQLVNHSRTAESS